MRTRVIQEHGKTSNRRPTDQPDVAATTKSHGRVVSLIRRRPLAAFFVIAFALTWMTVPIGSFMAAGPLVAALVVLGLTEGRPGIRALGRRMVQWRVGWPYYVVALVVPVAVGLSAGAGTLAFGASDAAFANLGLSSLALTFGLRMVMPVFAPLGEEPGWRGFALPRLQTTRTPFAATLLLGVIVAVWHVPLLWVSDVKFEPVMLLGTVAVTFWYTWLFDHTRGSVFITMVAHAADGLVGAKLLADGGFHGVAVTRFEVLYSAAWLVVAAVVVLTNRRRWFTPVTDAALLEGRSVTRPRRRFVRSAAAATVLVALAITGLAATASATTIDRDEYIHQADSICSRTVEKTDAVVEDLGFTPSDGEARVAAEKVVALQRAELRNLRALSVPRKDADQLSAVYAAMQHGWDRVEAHPSVLFDVPGPLAKATRLASAYGLDVCGRG